MVVVLKDYPLVIFHTQHVYLGLLLLLMKNKFQDDKFCQYFLSRIFLLKAAYIGPWLNDFWWWISKLIIPLGRLKSWTLLTVNPHAKDNGNYELFIRGDGLFLWILYDASCFVIGTHIFSLPIFFFFFGLHCVPSLVYVPILLK